MLATQALKALRLSVASSFRGERSSLCLYRERITSHNGPCLPASVLGGWGICVAWYILFLLSRWGCGLSCSTTVLCGIYSLDWLVFINTWMFYLKYVDENNSKYWQISKGIIMYDNGFLWLAAPALSLNSILLISAYCQPCRAAYINTVLISCMHNHHSANQTRGARASLCMLHLFLQPCAPPLHPMALSSKRWNIPHLQL